MFQILFDLLSLYVNGVLLLCVYSATCFLSLCRFVLVKAEQLNERVGDYLRQVFSATPQVFKEHGQFAPLALGNIHYLIVGKSSSPLIVLLNSEFTTLQSWLPIAKILSHSGYQVLMFDYFGTGYSDHPAVQCTLDMYVETTIELLDFLYLNDRPFCALGASMGSLIAMQLAADYPERVSRLIMCAPCAYEPSLQSVGTLIPYLHKTLFKVFLQDSNYLQFAYLQSWMQIVYLKALMYSVVTSVYCNYFVNLNTQMFSEQSGQSFTRMRQDFMQMYLQKKQEKYLKLAHEMMNNADFLGNASSILSNIPFYGQLDSQVSERLKNHPKRVLIVCGQNDDRFPFNNTNQWYRNSIPQAKQKVINNSCREVHIDAPVKLSSAVLSFFNQN
ncbi:hypothetical protein MIR68_002781 [Amoeboaphelidium protococcarum]|nr:hypothetical protein MIR68_002781 [Amoeboaphelidium protococcarum]